MVTEFEKAGRVGKKGGSWLECLNDYIPPVIKKEGLPWWLWFTITLLLAGSTVTLFLLREPKMVGVKKVITVEKVVYRDCTEKTKRNSNAAELVQGKADLASEAKSVFHDLVKPMEANPDLKLKIGGHTSEEGDEAFNQRLSEERAQIAIGFLISQGILVDRLWAEDKEPSEPIDPGNPDVSRRTEFIVIKWARKGSSSRRS